MLTPTFTSVAVAGISGYYAYESAQAALLTGNDKLILAGAVGVGTYVAAKVGKSLLSGVGSLIGLAVGGAGGAGAGALLGNSRSGAGEGATIGGVFGAAAGAVSFAVAGALIGFWGGAVLGHNVTTNVGGKFLLQNEQKDNAPKVQAPVKFTVSNPQ
jgi:hypothetical protein